MAGFKARARALDMLGRQQISGIPTAISELFKNAYDAYADNVIVDYFRSDGLFVLRDDGFGMTKDEFENRWLTIGTESKVNTEFGGLKKIPIPEGKETRSIMGEKGIGRLAIAMLGSQVLIVTKAVRGTIIHGYVVSFINWRLFEQPGLNLEDIYIPVKEFNSFPTNKEIQELINDTKQHIENISNKIEKIAFTQIIEDLTHYEKFNIQEREFRLKEPCKYTSNEDSGTRFYIFPSNPLLIKDLEDETVDDDASSLKKMLIGFTDDVMPGHKKIPLKTHFRDYKYPEYFEDVISETNFFSEDEFYKGDHLFIGRFNEFGQFIGKVKIYGKEQAQEYAISWPKSKGKHTACGPFDLVLTTIQGTQSESLLDKETHTSLNSKLYKFGGLYIYKDGIRILPYGNNKYDFLDIEYRRSKHAGDYYWSYRRLLGAIRLQSGVNDTLKEKAGREGFQESVAFREMREILINFFVQTAKDFFAEKGIYTDYFQQIRSERKARDELLKKEEKKKKSKKDLFAKELYGILNAIENREYEGECSTVLEKLNHSLAEIDALQNKESAALKLVNAEKIAFEELNRIKNYFLLSKPRGIALNKKLDQDYTFYKNKIPDLEKTYFMQTYREIELLIGEKSRKAQIELDRRKRIDDSLSRLSIDAKKQIQQQAKTTDEARFIVNDNIEKTTKESLKSVEKIIRETYFSFGQTDFKDMDDNDIFSWRINVESQIISVMEKEKKELETIQALLDNVKWEKDDEGNIASYIDVIEANDSKLYELEEKANLDSDLAQLGMAIHVINHEFDSSIKMVRENLRRLKAWADVNQGLGGIYNGIKDSFEHLDGYLTLFTPLNRRLNRKVVDIKGFQIEEFILNLFRERFKRHDIELKSSKEFRQAVLNTIPSSIYPVFVNIIDNATYWLKGRSEHGIIDLDIDNYGFIISNNGAPILERDREVIFEMGFSKKPGGRGLGLHISNEALREQGMSLEVVDPKKGFNVTFRIMNPKGI